MSIAKALGTPIAFDNIEERAWVELASVGITRSWLEEPSEKLSREQVIARADEIVPGISDGRYLK